MVAKPSSHHRRPSSNPRMSHILSHFLPQDWQFKGEGGGGGGESMKLCAEGVNWRCENEGDVRQLGGKDYTLLNAEQIVYISLVIITIKIFVLLLLKNFCWL